MILKPETFRTIAERMREMGLWVFPISIDGKKTPLVKWKAFQGGPPTADDLALWYRFPYAGAGLPTGIATGIFVLDADGPEAFAWLKEREMPRTWSVATRRGAHYYFRWPGFDVANSSGAIGPHVDIRGRGGFVAVAGSLGKDKFVYYWLPGRSPYCIPLASAPAWLVTLLRPKPQTERPRIQPRAFSGRLSNYATRALEAELARLRAAGQGSRNDTATRVSFKLGQLIGGGELPGGEVVQALFAIVDDWPNSARTRDTIARAIQAGARYPRCRMIS